MSKSRLELWMLKTNVNILSNWMTSRTVPLKLVLFNFVCQKYWCRLMCRVTVEPDTLMVTTGNC